jgi:hypothetical protein
MLVWERMESAEGIRTKRVVENVGSERRKREGRWVVDVGKVLSTIPGTKPSIPPNNSKEELLIYFGDSNEFNLLEESSSVGERMRE